MDSRQRLHYILVVDDPAGTPKVAKIPNEALEYFKKQGQGGKESGKARMEKMTTERRSEIAKKAAAARWDRATLQNVPRKKSARGKK
jgi:hypothetical protein